MNAIRNLSRILGAAAVATAILVATALPAAADHAGEKMTTSKSTGLADGDTIDITFSNFVPGGTDGQHPNVKFVIAGQDKFNGIPDKLNFTEYANAPTAVVGADGAGSGQFVVTADHGTMQDGTTLDCTWDKCWLIVIQEPFLGSEGQPRFAATPITFGTAAPATTTPPAPTTAAAAPVTGDVPTTPAVDPNATTVTEPPTTVAPTTAVSTTTAAESVTATADKKADADADEGSNAGLIIGIVAAAAVVLGGGGYMATRKKPGAPGPGPGVGGPPASGGGIDTQI